MLLNWNFIMNAADSFFLKHPFGAYVLASGHIALYAFVLAYFGYQRIESLVGENPAIYVYLGLLLVYNALYMLWFPRYKKSVLLLIGCGSWLVSFGILFAVVS